MNFAVVLALAAEATFLLSIGLMVIIVLVATVVIRIFPRGLPVLLLIVLVGATKLIVSALQGTS